MRLLLLTLLLTFHFVAQAQSTNHEKEYATKAVWIEMMDDSNVNYFQAIKAYEIYWQNHTPPEGESDMNVKEVTKNKKRFSKKEINKMRADAAMRVQIKKFNWWKNKMEPFVKEDGTLMTPEERIKIAQ